jgi:hypothetical protein
LGSAVDVDAAWTSQTVNLNVYAGQTIQILIEAAEPSLHLCNFCFNQSGQTDPKMIHLE